MVEIPRVVTQYADQSISVVYHSLRASRRRLVAGLLAHRAITASTGMNLVNFIKSDQKAAPVVTVRDLAREVTAIEEDVSVESATGDSYHNVYTSLIQTHLPKLNNVSAIKYNDSRKTVSPDRNLLPLIVVVTSTSPVAQMLFDDTIVDT
ncbi:DUF7344 domain-containing protein [Haloquadratum walsbyi]|nr:hypothetical protein [Haloquadratum walsbyi]